jgi:hypothetical protein
MAARRKKSSSSSRKSKGLTPNKARQILHDKRVRGHKLTAAQFRFFGAKSKGATVRFAKKKSRKR